MTMSEKDRQASVLTPVAQPVVTITDDTGVEGPAPVDTRSVFRPFTRDSYRRLLAREAEQAKHQVEKIPDQFHEGRLVDGQLKFGEQDNEEEKIERDPDLVEGKGIPERLGELPPELLGKAIEEIDPHLQDKVSGTQAYDLFYLSCHSSLAHYVSGFTLFSCT